MGPVVPTEINVSEPTLDVENQKYGIRFTDVSPQKKGKEDYYGGELEKYEAVLANLAKVTYNSSKNPFGTTVCSICKVDFIQSD